MYGAPCVGSDETVYLSSWDGYLYAVNPDGTLKWRFLVQVEQRLWSSPALSADESIVYVAGNGSLLAVEQSSAAVGGGPVLRWAVRTGGEVLASPTIGPDGAVFIGGLDGVMRAVAPNGTELWAHGSGGGEGAIYASAAVSEHAVFYTSMVGGRVVALARHGGALLWSSSESPLPIPSSPSLSADGATLYVGSTDGSLRALRAADGGLQWAYEVGTVDGSSPAVSPSDGTVYIGSIGAGGGLYAVAPSGELRWKLPVDSGVQSSPAVGEGGVVYFASFKASLFAVEPSDGAVRWAARLGGSSFSSPALGRHGLYVGANDGGLYAFSG